METNVTLFLAAGLFLGWAAVASADTLELNKVCGRVQGAQKAGRYVGQSSLDLRLTELAVGA
jgi:hypothetical protein